MSRKMLSEVLRDFSNSDRNDTADFGMHLKFCDCSSFAAVSIVSGKTALRSCTAFSYSVGIHSQDQKEQE